MKARSLLSSTLLLALSFTIACGGAGGDAPTGASGASAGGSDGSAAGNGGSTSTAGSGAGGASGAGSSTAGAGSSTAGAGSSGVSGSGGGAVDGSCVGLNLGSGTTIPCVRTADGGASCIPKEGASLLSITGGAALSGVKQISSVGFTDLACAVLDSGAVKCGRHNGLDATNVIESGATMVSGGLNGACAIVSGAVQCWAMGGTTSALTAVATPGVAVQIACSYGGCCSLNDAGVMSCWGNNTSGMFGVGDSATSTETAVSPTQVTEKIIDIGPGQDANYAVTESGKLIGWGADWAGQLGGKAATNLAPALILESGAVAVAGGQFHFCVVMDDGTVQCSGKDTAAGLSSLTLKAVPGISNAVAIGAGKHYSCAALADGKVSCWGEDYGGATPTVVTGLGDVSCTP